ncbi:MAG TPA: adenylosuccinate lyase [Patescibacteria group bacterium]
MTEKYVFSEEAVMLLNQNMTYRHVLSERYPSKEMKEWFSGMAIISRWRQMWIEIARGQMNLGIERIRPEMLEEMQRNKMLIDFVLAKKEEAARKHDVMAHVHTFGAICPTAAPIIHLGCTSCEITDNSELIAMRDGLQMIAVQLARAINYLKKIALQWKDQPTLAWTHFQFAQPTTVGKRICIWIQDLMLDLMEIERLIEELRFRGIQGTTGTQASFLELFEGDHAKVKELNRMVTKACGFKKSFIITGQTYTRKQDAMILSRLASLAASLHKIGTDIRLLANKMEMEEPSTEGQDGSSAMPFKRNPMLNERLCSLARYLWNLLPNANETHALQWLERTLDDSAGRRMYISEAFLTADAALIILQKIAGGLIVYPKMIERNMQEPLQFLASEEILMDVVRAGGSRQEAHEKVKLHSLAAGRRIKQEGLPCDLFERIRSDDFFAPVHDKLDSFLDPSRFIGRAPFQVEEFIEEEINPLLAKYEGQLEKEVVINV